MLKLTYSKIALTILLCISQCEANAKDFYAAEHGPQPDHLVPLDCPPSKYDQRIASSLFVTEATYGRFVVLPAFDPEMCLAVHGKEGAGKASSDRADAVFFLTVTEASESLYYSMAENKDARRTKKVKISRRDRQISREMAVAIQRVWGQMLQKTRYPSKASIGLDGVTFQFSVWVRGLGDLQGETWSPRKGLTREMVAIGEELIDFAKGKETSEKSIIEWLRRLEARIGGNP